MNLSVKFTGIEEFKALLEPEQYKRAARSAINKVAEQGRAEATRSIREMYSIKVADVNKKFRIKRADANLKALIQAEGRPIPLLYFNAKQLTTQNRLITRTTGRQLKRPGKQSQGVTVQITGKQKTVLPHAFIATMKSGHMGVFMRMGKGRLKIQEKAFVTVPTVFGGKTTMPRVQQFIRDKWPQVMNHELEYVLSKHR